MRKTTVVRPNSWRLVGLALLVYCVLIAAFSLLTGDLMLGTGIGLSVFFTYRFGVAFAFLNAHQRRGLRAFKQSNYAAALAHFERSEQQFADRPWLDRYRWLFFLSSALYPFHALAIYNQAFCYVRMGDSANAMARLDTLLTLHPNMHLGQDLREVLVLGRELSSDSGD